MGRKKSWHEQAEALKAEAEKLPHGKDREALETKARQLELAANINQWLSSPGLRWTDKEDQRRLELKRADKMV
jgi:hypothetical protein